MSAGVLLVNLGSPDSPSVGDVRRYLREFLMDSRVIDAPWPVRAAVVYGRILPFRPRESAHAYRSVWTREGSPLMVTSKRVHAELERRLGVPVELAMRYQNPSIESAIRKLDKQGVRRLFVIPLFPHYAMSSYETAVKRVDEVRIRLAPEMTLTVQPPYYDSPDYISALVAGAQEFLNQSFDHLLVTFHGVPERQIRKKDPTGGHCLKRANCCEVASPAHRTCYRAQCFKTVRAFAKLANVPSAKFSVAFQSRLGREPWLGPSTEDQIRLLGHSGVRKLLVICPAFVTDCLETIEEIGIRGGETFLQAGGQELIRIPCLNEHPLWIQALENMARSFCEEDFESARVCATCR
jgi:ferrochelatase